MRLERLIDLPRSIVWEALVDPVLAEGWLHPQARLVEGVEVVERHDPSPAHPGEPAVLDSRGTQLGRTRFELVEFVGGTRGAVTRLELEILDPLSDGPRPPVVAGWQTRLDQLEELLRGHPVDWGHWERDQGSAYENHLLRAAGLVRPRGQQAVG